MSTEWQSKPSLSFLCPNIRDAHENMVFFLYRRIPPLAFHFTYSAIQNRKAPSPQFH